MTKGRKKLHEVTLRPIEGAHVISETVHKIARGGQGGGPEYDMDRTERVHATHEDMIKHLTNVFHTESGTDKPGGKYNEEDRGGPESE